MAGTTTGVADAGTAPTAGGLDSDQALVAAVRRGDDRAFETLYGRYQRRISAYVYGMVHDHGRAEDITQEVFISALRRMRATDRPIAFKPWVYEIAKNACIDQFRRSRRTEEVSFDAGEGDVLEGGRLGSSPAADAAMDAKEQLDHLCGAFGGLSDTHHQILVLRELEGLSYQQIGERLGMSRPSVESTLFRARRRLSEEYDELVSGARCRSVQALYAGGATALGARDRRRLARHISHCQPCRRQAHLAGVDTVALRGAVVATVVRHVAAFLPLPALLRFRRGGGGGSLADAHAPLLGHSAATLAEPAVTWTKAAAAGIAVLVAGGAGMAGNPSAPVGKDLAPAVVREAPAQDDRRAAPAPAPASERRAPAREREVTVRAGRLREAAARPRGERAPSQSAPAARAEPAPKRSAGAEGLPVLSRIGDAEPPSAGPQAPQAAPPERPRLLAGPESSSGSGSDTSQPLDVLVVRPAVNLPADPLDTAQTLATKLDGQLGEAVAAARAAIAPAE